MSTNITQQKFKNRIHVTRGNSKFSILFEQTTYLKNYRIIMSKTERLLYNYFTVEPPFHYHCCVWAVDCIGEVSDMKDDLPHEFLIRTATLAAESSASWLDNEIGSKTLLRLETWFKLHINTSKRRFTTNNDSPWFFQ